jgi:hypothetical protein
LRVVTIERFGKLTSNTSEDTGYIYKGDGWLLRFVVQSADHFFQIELENLCGILNDLDVRAIYKLDLYGDGSGLYDVRLYVSFEEPPEDEQIAQLQFASPGAGNYEYHDDTMDNRLVEFLRGASQTAKKKLAEALVKETTDASGTNHIA